MARRLPSFSPVMAFGGPRELAWRDVGAKKPPRAPARLVAELTHRAHATCAPQPVAVARGAHELDTASWLGVLVEAHDLGVSELELSGGEPLVRGDLEAMVAGARALGLGTHLVTSGTPLTRARLKRLAGLGLDRLVLWIQAIASPPASGRDALDDLLAAAAWARDLSLPITAMAVLDRRAARRVEDLTIVAEALGADRLDLRRAPAIGWALEDRRAELPSDEDLRAADDAIVEARRRLDGVLGIGLVGPDDHAGLPRACMDGWGRRTIVVSPDGLVLPCHAARSIPGLAFERVATRPLSAIWRDSPGIVAFRGDEWMRDPCRSCDRRHLDRGGCRCQAYHLTGDAAATDPACALSPSHDLVRAAREPVVPADALAARARLRS